MVINNFWQQWIEAHVDLEKDTEWLGENGWTMPLWADPRIVSKLRNASENIDKAFVSWYITNDSKRLRELWIRLRNSKGLDRWRTIIDQTIYSYLERRYAVAVPCLLIVIEGAVAHGTDDLYKRATNPRSSASNKRLQTEAGMRKLIWISIQSFLKPIFGSASFAESRPITLNRHWILHGRDTNAWGLRRESIRLFHALDTISTTVDRKR